MSAGGVVVGIEDKGREDVDCDEGDTGLVGVVVAVGTSPSGIGILDVVGLHQGKHGLGPEVTLASVQEDSAAEKGTGIHQTRIHPGTFHQGDADPLGMILCMIVIVGHDDPYQLLIISHTMYLLYHIDDIVGLMK